MLLTRGRSFGAKLVLLATLTSGLAVVVAFVTIRLINWYGTEQRALLDAQGMAELIASSSAEEMSTGDRAAVEDRLANLSMIRRVNAVRIEDAQGDIFAHYRRDNQTTDTDGQTPGEGFRFIGDRLFLTHPITFDNRALGTLTIVYDLQPGRAQQTRETVLSIAVGVVAVLVAWMLALRMHRVLARPIAELVEVTEKVATANDYGLRATRYSDDELGHLTDALNQMLERVQLRNRDLKRVQLALSHSEERYRKIVNNAIDAVVTMDDRGIVTGWNTSAEQSFGWLMSEAVGKPLADLIIPKRYREAHGKGLERYLHTGETAVLNKRIEITALRRDGREFPVELAITPIKIDQTSHFSAFIRDITNRKQAERELQDREERFRAVVNTAVDGIVTIDHGGIIRFVNPAVESMFGYAGDDLIGRNVNVLMPEPHRGQHDGYIAHYLKTGDAKIIGTGREVEGMRSDGSVFPMALSIAAFRVGDERFFTGIIHDLTKRKATEEALADERRLLRALVDNAPDCIYIKDREGRFLMNNPAHLKALGAADQDEALGKTDLDYLPESVARQYLADDMRIIKTRQPLLNHDEALVCPDESVRWMATSKIPILDQNGRAVRLVGISRDITVLREALMDLEATNNELTHKNKELEQFVYTVSHDLKSPIVTCTGFLALMREDLEAGQHEGLLPSMERLERAINRMHDSINDLLELSRVGRVQMDQNQLDMNRLVHQVVEDLGPKLHELGFEIDVAENLPTVIGDRVRITEVFENLVGNAMKYAVHDNDCPRIEIGATMRDEEICYFVRDNGPGIDPRFHSKVFGLFQRLDNKKEGTGIGLTIVTRIMEVHRGRVWLESEVGRGATFWLAFPIAVVDHIQN